MLQQKVDEEKMIQFSWKRCLEFGLNPSELPQDQVLNDQQIRQLLAKNKELTDAAIPILEKFATILTQAGHMASLTDKNGTIIYTLGDECFKKQARKMQMQVGANWLENNRGTNAIGVALLEKNPIRVHGDQHFYITARFLSCAASPIFSPSGQIIGAINISGKKELFNPYHFLLSQIIADDIRNCLLLQQSKRDQQPPIAELEYTINKYVSYPYVSLDHEQRIVRANRHAKKILGESCIGKKIERYQHSFTIEPIIHDSTSKHFIAVQQKLINYKDLYTFADIKGSCTKITQLKELAKKVAATDMSTLLFGETGTGKELFAQSIHTSSFRAHQPFIAVNCSAIPESLIESELFGYIGGAFTGAHSEGRKGKFEAAHRGTLFLDEIGDMSLRAQASLLRALQEGEITAVGSHISKKVDVRIIAATNKNLLEEISSGNFRADLYYRLRGILLSLPSLRERSDIIEIAKSILKNSGKYLSEDAKNLILSYSWPGNIRELSSALVEAAFLAEGDIIYSKDFQLEKEGVRSTDEPLIQSLKEIEKETIRDYIRLAQGNISHVAEWLQISRNTLYRKMKEYNLKL
ncbi:sigma-54-dependent Fis family transcriptional regulator [Bacillus sp. FJAT-50079]|uniref:sigma-54-dependent Fis family transcriptional regulator n=1 Tax=Bacillus sp. FJAT-50079 TaxID=2833577 RepID=UPI001BC94639|nr:sigma-54-dependent Fis family transcriptional regulator [Bacillus sp. FJAT-50079]MBS4207434.1 sigma-54-dependent Fis family transcriptional regulator [Bacillus sp. FJAT-50079]